MADHFFGHCNDDGTVLAGEPPGSLGAGWNASTMWNDNTDYPLTAPGVGNLDVVNLDTYAAKGTTTGNVRLAIYNSTYNSKLVEGSAEVAVDNVAVAWKGHTAFSAGAAQLVGGTKYIIAESFDGGQTLPYGWTDWGASYGVLKTAADYTGGFPASLSGSATDYKYTARAGVNHAAAGGVASRFLALLGAGV